MKNLSSLMILIQKSSSNDQKEYERLLSSFKNNLRIMIRLYYGASILDNSFIETGKISKLSIDNLDNEFHIHKVKITSKQFKENLMINILSLLEKNIDIIIENIIIANEKNIKLSEKISLLMQINDCLINMVDDIEYDCSYKQEFIKIIEMFMMSYNNSSSIMKILNKELGKLEDFCETNNKLLFKGSISDDIILQNLILLSYVLCTGNTSLKKILYVPEKVNTKDKVAIKSLFESLGCLINEKGKTYIFKCFEMSYPLVRSQFYDYEYNNDLKCGINAMLLLSFLSENKKLVSYINKLI